MPAVLVPIAQGCEELETVTIIDILRRGDVEVTVAGLDAEPVTASRGVRLMPDATLDEALRREYDMVALPGGGKGAENLANDARITNLLKEMADKGKYTVAICAGPTVLAKAGLLAGKKATSYPAMLDQLKAANAQCVEDPVVQDGRIITSRGPGTAMDFALTLVGVLQGKETRDKVEKALVRP
ncbi:MAG: DJ-1 family glyoxalase III [Candidatus Hydrogenedentota bacterium]